MENDGHIKLTAAAIANILTSHTIEWRLCHLSMFQEVTPYKSDSSSSDLADPVGSINWFLSYLLSKYTVSLGGLGPHQKIPSFPSGGDFDRLNTYDDPTNQRFSFIETREKTELSVHQNACDFIKENMSKWVRQAQSDIERLNHQNVNHRIKQTGVEYLSLALHCLQDSFSTSRTLRSWAGSIEFNRQLKPNAYQDFDLGTSENPAPIVRIYGCHKQAHDSTQGVNTEELLPAPSTSTGITQLSVQATQELIEMGLMDIFNKRCFSNWEAFKSKWLKIDLKQLND